MDDATGRLERIAKSVKARLDKAEEEIPSSVVNRPLDSEPMSGQEFSQDYSMVKDDPVLLTQRLEEFQNQYLFKRGLEKWMDWIENGESDKGS